MILLVFFGSERIINLHPALPGEFAGANGIGDAFTAFQSGKISYTGCMCHEVVEAIDSGRVLTTASIKISKDDTEISLQEKDKNI